MKLSNKTVFAFINILVACMLTACDRSYTPRKSDFDAELKQMEFNKQRDAARIAQPPTDPSTCKDNPEGYLYFTVGDELFRVNKDSPIIIGAIYPDLDENNKQIPNASGIPKGCKENPLRKGKPGSSIRLELEGNFSIKRNYKTGRDDLLIKMELQDLSFAIEDVPQGNYARLTSTLYSMKDFKWENRYEVFRDIEHGENGDFVCEDVAENFVHCRNKYLVDKGLKEKFGVYVANPEIAKSAQNLPFVLQCDPAIPDVKCNALYRLYPTVNISYSVRYVHPEAFDPKELFLLDQYFRKMYELMRVKK